MWVAVKKQLDGGGDKSEGVKVAVRCRPFNGREKKLGAKQCCEMEDGVKVILADPAGKAKVSGWGDVYCCDFLLLPVASCCFLLLPVAPSVACSCLETPYTLRDMNFRRLLPSPTVSQCLQPV